MIADQTAPPIRRLLQALCRLILALYHLVRAIPLPCLADLRPTLPDRPLFHSTMKLSAGTSSAACEPSGRRTTSTTERLENLMVLIAKPKMTVDVTERQDGLKGPGRSRGASPSEARCRPRQQQCRTHGTRSVWFLPARRWSARAGRGCLLPCARKVLLEAVGRRPRADAPRWLLRAQDDDAGVDDQV